MKEWNDYYVIRFMPNELRGEFINIGIAIALPNGGFIWEIEPNMEKAIAIGGEGADERVTALVEFFSMFAGKERVSQSGELSGKPKLIDSLRDFGATALDNDFVTLDFMLASGRQSRKSAGQFKLIGDETHESKLEQLMDKLVR